MSKTRSGARFTFLQKWNLFGAFIRLEFLRVYVLGCQIEINIVFVFFNLSPYATKNSVSRHVHAFITESTFFADTDITFKCGSTHCIVVDRSD